MNAQTESNLAVPSENWDEDFEFQQSHASEHMVTRKKVFVSSHNDSPDPRRISTASSYCSEDCDFNHEIRRRSTTVFGDKKNYYPVSASPTRPRLADWSDSAPSTPTKRPNPENWDDDFEDKTDSPNRKIVSHPLETYRGPQRREASSRNRRRHPSESENWDDISMKDSNRSQTDSSQVKWTRHGAYTDSSDDDMELGFTDTNEDKTVTARSRTPAMLNNYSPPPPVPALPTSLLGHDPNVGPISRSPTESFFSIPVSSTGRNSTTHAHSTTNLALRRRFSGASSTLALLPPSPPIHRERRRLRKKSRPPHFENNIFELQDRGEPPPPSSSPHRPTTPERAAIPPLPSAERLVSPNSSKVPLISRIGSVKKWGVRRKRASTVPSEVIQGTGSGNETTPPPPSTLSYTSPSNKGGNWFFRAAGVGPEPGPLPPRAELNGNNKSSNFDHLGEMTHESPTTLHKRKSLGLVNLRRVEQLPVHDAVNPSPLPLKPRRPASMQPQVNPRNSHGLSSTSSTPITRSASSTSGTGSTSVEDLEKGGQREGSRTFIRGIRKISLVGGNKKHERTKSFGAAEPTRTLPVLLAPPVLVAVRPASPTQPDTSLPVIELGPPSLPQEGVPPNTQLASQSGLSPESHTSPAKALTSSVSGGITIGNLNSPAKVLPLPQTASLGRSTPPSNIAGCTSVPRRNSLGDLKIPMRISQAQVGLRKDLSMVREFATNIEQLKRLEVTYGLLTAEVQVLIGPLQTSSPPLIHPLPMSGSLPHPNINIVSAKPHRYLASAFDKIKSKYLAAWECARLLIELGGGTTTQPSSPTVSVSAPALHSHGGSSECRKNRERAITLAGDESKPNAMTTGPPSINVANLTRSVTERHELSPRQLVLLKEILNNTDSSFVQDLPIMEESTPNRDWRWGDAMSSTVTLPSEDSQGAPSVKKRRTSRLGMSGLRDVLRSLKRSHLDQPMPLPHHHPSSIDPSTDSSLHCQHRSNYPRLLTHRRREKTSTGPESIRPSSSLKQNASPRRPSLASIFRLGQKHKSSSTGTPNQSVENIQSITSRSSGRDSCSITDEGDWDRIDSTSDLDAADATKHSRVGPVGCGTVRGRSSYLDGHSGCVVPVEIPGALQSQSSIDTDPVTLPVPQIRSTPLSNVEESLGTYVNSSRPTSRTAHRGAKTGSIRSAPPRSLVSPTANPNAQLLPDPKFALMPENIKPLLDNSREVLIRLQACIDEIRLLLAEQDHLA